MERFSPDNERFRIFREAMNTDARVRVGGGEIKPTKAFQRGGGFKGTAINATYTVMRLTDAFGPVGSGWGYEIKESQVIQGRPILKGDTVIGHEQVQVMLIRFWWQTDQNKIASFDQVGQTMLVTWSDKNGRFSTDEEAWKKSLTDAITKAASHLGFAADIHLGLWDDNKYTTEREAEGDEQIAEARKAEVDAVKHELAQKAIAICAECNSVTSLDQYQQIRVRASALRPALVEHGMTATIETIRNALETARALAQTGERAAPPKAASGAD